MKRLDLYTFIYNDEDMLPYFLEYYRFVDRMTFIDSGSNDNTLRILKRFATPSHPIIRIIQTGLTYWDHEVLHIYRNEIWKDSEFSLVMFPDIDEIFYHTKINEFLRKTKYDIYEMEGFEMVASKMPRLGQSILSINKGVKFTIYNKSTIFNPKIDICFPNAHLRCSMNTNVNIGDIKLLHYRNMGLKMMIKRNERERARLAVKCKYRSPLTERELKSRYDDLQRKAIKVI